MAGIRKSHKKSKNGCNQCRRRHVRCDETLPEWLVKPLMSCTGQLPLTYKTSSRKCTRQNRRCDFLDGAPLALLGDRRSRMILPTESGPEEGSTTSVSDRALISLSWVDHGLPMTRLPSEESRLLHALSSNLTQTRAIEVSKYIVNVAYMPR